MTWTMAMRVVAVTTACLLLGTCTAPEESASRDAAGTAAAVTLFENVTLIDGDTGAALERAAFLVDGSRVAAVGRAGDLTLPAGTTRVDLSGKTVMPVLVSAHVHIGLLDGLDFGPEVYTRARIVEHLQRYAYYGVGAVLTAGTDAGPVSFEIRDDPPLMAARLLTAGQGLAAPNGGPGFPVIAHTAFAITTADEGRQRVRELAAARANAVKIWVDDRQGRVTKLTPELYRPIIDEAHRHGLPALAHVYYLEDAHALVDAGIDGFMHPVRDAVMDDELIAMMKARDVFVAANIGGSRRATLSALSDATLARLVETVPLDVVDRYQRAMASRTPQQLENARRIHGNMAASLVRLQAAGVPIVLGGDTGIPNAWHGWAEHDELAAMVDAGLTPAAVLVAATSAAARVLGLEDLGTIAPGKRADFVVLDANPLDDMTNTQRIAGVYLSGVPVDREALRARWR
jgi:imidazolonepropionase-like amidohydrolase